MVWDKPEDNKLTWAQRQAKGVRDGEKALFKQVTIPIPTRQKGTRQQGPNPGPPSGHGDQGPLVSRGAVQRSPAKGCKCRLWVFSGGRGDRAGPQDEPDPGADDHDQEVQTFAQPCPCCGGRMIIIETFEPGYTPGRHAPRAPPQAKADRA